MTLTVCLATQERIERKDFFSLKVRRQEEFVFSPCLDQWETKEKDLRSVILRGNQLHPFPSFSSNSLLG